MDSSTTIARARVLALLTSLSVLQATGLAISLIFAYIFVGSLYRLYFHPLAKFKGPKLYALTNLVQIRHVVRGEWARIVLALHEEHGPIVRVAPNEISYIDERAWDDIYKARRDEKQLFKAVARQLPDFPNNLFSQRDDYRHHRARKILSPVVNDRGVRLREDAIKQNIASFIKHLRESSASAVEIVGWYEALATDIIGCFISNEDFGVLPTGKPHAIQAENHKILIGLGVGTVFAKNFFLREVVVNRKPLPRWPLYVRLCKERWDKRVSGKQADHDDVLGVLIKSVDTEKGLPEDNALRVFADFVFAGTDTVAITLSGLTYLVLQNPSTLKKLNNEVRAAFKTADEITLASVNQLKYQNAVISETFRLWPPGPETQRRIVNKGGKVIVGEWIPAGTHVGVYHYVAGRYSGAWKDVNSFVPERWLQGNQEYRDDRRGVIQIFNVGPRNCVGQQVAYAMLRLTLANLIWHFDMQFEEPIDGDWMNVPMFGLAVNKKPLPVKLTYIR